MTFNECSVEILRRCARAAGLIERHEPLAASLETFGLMVALECAELVDKAASNNIGAESPGHPIRSLFFEQACAASELCSTAEPGESGAAKFGSAIRSAPSHCPQRNAVVETAAEEKSVCQPVLRRLDPPQTAPPSGPEQSEPAPQAASGGVPR